MTGVFERGVNEYCFIAYVVWSGAKESLFLEEFGNECGSMFYPRYNATNDWHRRAIRHLLRLACNAAQYRNTPEDLNLRQHGYKDPTSRQICQYVKVRKVHPGAGNEGLNGKLGYSSNLSLISALEGVGGQHHTPTALARKRDRVHIFISYSRLGGPQGRSERVRKISPPPAFDPRTVQPLVGRYTDHAFPAHQNLSKWEEK